MCVKNKYTMLSKNKGRNARKGDFFYKLLIKQENEKQNFNN